MKKRPYLYSDELKESFEIEKKEEEEKEKGGEKKDYKIVGRKERFESTDLSRVVDFSLIVYCSNGRRI